LTEHLLIARHIAAASATTTQQANDKTRTEQSVTPGKQTGFTTCDKPDIRLQPLPQATMKKRVASEDIYIRLSREVESL